MNDRVPRSPSTAQIWPELPLDAWQDTFITLHRWLQIVGKVRLALCPLVNHWWNVTFYVTTRGLTTSIIPYGSQSFQMDFDFLSHELRIRTSRGAFHSLPLAPRTVAQFYHDVMAILRASGIDVKIWTTPVEVEERTPFELDTQNASYDKEYAQRFWRILLQVDRLLKVFRSRFVGKSSPVHFFWGASDIAVTRFSGRKAPPHPGTPNAARSIMLEAYSHEVSSCGFWPGFGYGQPAFYAYAYPEPAGYKDRPIRPREAFYNADFGEFLLPYEAVRTATHPDAMVLAFLQSTYEVAANLGRWDRSALERQDQGQLDMTEIEMGRS